MGFFDRVYALVAAIPAGKVLTYGRISHILGGQCSARYVGYAMASAPAVLALPCHRVVNRLGEMAGNGHFGGEENQRHLLGEEGVPFRPDGRIDLPAALWEGPYPETDQKNS